MHNMSESSLAKGMFENGLKFSTQELSAEQIEVTGLSGISTGNGEQHTLSFWMKWDGDASQNPVVSSWGNYNLQFLENYSMFGFNTNQNDIIGIPYDKLAGDWIHITATFVNGDDYVSSDICQLYINGQIQTLKRPDGSPSADLNAKVGTAAKFGGIYSGSEADYRYGGYLDDIQIYNRELAADEVASLVYSTRYEYDALDRMIQKVEAPVVLPDDTSCNPTTLIFL